MCSQRGCLRLLLAGVPPERILCLTFTKAGAAEMAERVHSTLAAGCRSRRRTCARTCSRWARTIATMPSAGPGCCSPRCSMRPAAACGSRPSTASAVAARGLPLEAGLVPGFRPLDDRAQAELSRGALIAMIEQAERSHDTALIEAVQALALRSASRARPAIWRNACPRRARSRPCGRTLPGHCLDFLDPADRRPGRGHRRALQ